MGRELQLSDAFVGLADTLADDFDVVDLFDRLGAHCVALTGADAVGILMADGRGRLRVIAASQERAQLLELLQLHSGQGPCVECYTRGAPVAVPRIASQRARWPRLVPAVLDAGFAAVFTVPLRLREKTIGAVNPFYPAADPAVDVDLHLAQVLADVAALAMLQWPPRPGRPEDVVADLQAAITGRVAIEQAKGVLAQSGGLSVAEAGAALRAYAQAHRVRLTDVARGLVRRTLEPGTVLRAVSRQDAEDSQNMAGAD
ncbi:MAG TPA: GAF and ANTAR domain-containing protein [Actinocrinis sp.]